MALLCGACADPLEPSDLAGTWGGTHIEIAFDSTGLGAVQYDCAHGRIVPPVELDAGGAFRASGEHVREHGGPVHEDELEDARPARYVGELRGNRLTLTVTLTDSGTVLGTYTVRRGEPGRLFRCL